MMEFYAPTCSAYTIEVGNVGEATKAVMMTDAVAPTVNGFAILAEVHCAEFEDMNIHAQTAIAVVAERIVADCEGEGEGEQSATAKRKREGEGEGEAAKRTREAEGEAEGEGEGEGEGEQSATAKRKRRAPKQKKDPNGAVGALAATRRANVLAALPVAA